MTPSFSSRNQEYSSSTTNRRKIKKIVLADFEKSEGGQKWRNPTVRRVSETPHSNSVEKCRILFPIVMWSFIEFAWVVSEIWGGAGKLCPPISRKLPERPPNFFTRFDSTRMCHQSEEVRRKLISEIPRKLTHNVSTFASCGTGSSNLTTLTFKRETRNDEYN